MIAIRLKIKKPLNNRTIVYELPEINSEFELAFDKRNKSNAPTKAAMAIRYLIFYLRMSIGIVWKLIAILDCL